MTPCPRAWVHCKRDFSITRLSQLSPAAPSASLTMGGSHQLKSSYTHTHTFPVSELLVPQAHSAPKMFMTANSYL